MRISSGRRARLHWGLAALLGLLALATLALHQFHYRGYCGQHAWNDCGWELRYWDISLNGQYVCLMLTGGRNGISLFDAADMRRKTYRGGLLMAHAVETPRGLYTGSVARLCLLGRGSAQSGALPNDKSYEWVSDMRLVGGVIYTASLAEDACCRIYTATTADPLAYSLWRTARAPAGYFPCGKLAFIGAGKPQLLVARYDGSRLELRLCALGGAPGPVLARLPAPEYVLYPFANMAEPAPEGAAPEHGFYLEPVLFYMQFVQLDGGVLVVPAYRDGRWYSEFYRCPDGAVQGPCAGRVELPRNYWGVTRLPRRLAAMLHRLAYGDGAKHTGGKDGA